jgi:hypothetical protein
LTPGGVKTLCWTRAAQPRMHSAPFIDSLGLGAGQGNATLIETIEKASRAPQQHPAALSVPANPQPLLLRSTLPNCFSRLPGTDADAQSQQTPHPMAWQATPLRVSLVRTVHQILLPMDLLHSNCYKHSSPSAPQSAHCACLSCQVQRKPVQHIQHCPLCITKADKPHSDPILQVKGVHSRHSLLSHYTIYYRTCTE